MTKTSTPAKSHRPQAYTVFGAAIVAGAAAAFGLNSVLDTHLAQARPQVESESILVALRALPAGAPVTVWDVGLRDWPKAMVPSSAMRVSDDLDNLVVRHPLREGQPILAVQLGRAEASADPVARPLSVAVPPTQSRTEPERDLWEPAPAVTTPSARTVAAVATPRTTVTTVSTTFASENTPPRPPTTITPTPVVETITTVTPTVQEPAESAVVATSPTPVTGPPTAATIASEGSATTDRPEQDTLVIPESTSASEAIVNATPAAPRTTLPTPANETGIATPAPIRTALRPSPSLIHAFSVPNRSALRTPPEDRAAGVPIPASVQPPSTARTVAGERTVATNAVEGSDKAPRMLPGDRDAAAQAAVSQPPRAPQGRASAARAPVSSAAPRAARSPGFSRGYRPN
jgi:hypothetical protein